MKIERWVAATAFLVLLGAGLVTVLLLNTEVPAPGVTATAPPGRPAAAGDTVQRALRSGKPTVVEFGANACASCRAMKPVLEALRREHGEDIAVVDVDLIAQREHDYLRRYRIQLMPTQVFFDAQGCEIDRHLGKISGAEILARLQVEGAPATPVPDVQRATTGGSL